MSKRPDNLLRLVPELIELGYSDEEIARKLGYRKLESLHRQLRRLGGPVQGASRVPLRDRVK